MTPSPDGERPPRFADRSDAGRRLAGLLEDYRDNDGVVLGIPRGGVPVAFEVARALSLPLDVVVVRKLGVPFQPELAIGAVGEGGAEVRNQEIVAAVGLGELAVARIAAGEREEVERRAVAFRGGRPSLVLTGRAALLVDDGIATGATCRAACEVARRAGASEVVLAVPVGPAESLRRLASPGAADRVVALSAPVGFSSVGEWYDDFSQTSDAEVTSLLAQADGGA